MSSTNARSVAAAASVAASSPAPLARVIPLRPDLDPRASRVHVHDWKVVSEESDGFGRVRELACTGCRAVRYA
ncbi:hypothetical protein [Nocardioides cavernaquae]|uniref:Uncharacterized protein n=1 Tax=Nocardioides cavernaquae TaxID=2321396 RepID=A0A3A5HGV4_9ACTN|nr:hypothetical protein [Nocardioides cavernaquae]RJS47120.1 hypothetical protein D4739_13420 [Nocardioides cavernaquae]